MVEKKIIRIGREVDYDVFYDDESGEIWFSDRMGEEDRLMVVEKKIIGIGREVDYDVFLDEVSGDVWFSVRMYEEDDEMDYGEVEW